MHRSGFIAVLGRPNVGKSTLVNAIVGEKISIVTSKPNTTRHAIVAVKTTPDFQLVFIDTPGLERRSVTLLNKAMSRAAVGAAEAADVLLLVIEAGKRTPADDRALEIVTRSGLPTILVVNKVDRINPRSRLLPFLEEVSKLHPFVEIVPVSATRTSNLETLQLLIAAQLPEQDPLYSASTVTTRDLRFRVAEMLREKLTAALHAEVPYGLGVEINEMEDGKDGRLIVDAIVWVDRESHKGIVVGKGGQQIKKVGTQARLELEKVLGRKVHLETRVKLKRNWAENAVSLQQFGYDGEK